MDYAAQEQEYYSSPPMEGQDYVMEDVVVEPHDIPDAHEDENNEKEEDIHLDRQQAIQSIEDPEEALETVDLIGQTEVSEHQVHPRPVSVKDPQTPPSARAVEHGVSRPGSVSPIISPISPRVTNGTLHPPESAQSVRHSSRQSKPVERFSVANQEASGHKPRRLSGNTSRPVSSSKSTSPSAVVKKSGRSTQKTPRRDSHSVPKLDDKASGSQVETNDEASQKLIRELLSKDRGLRGVN